MDIYEEIRRNLLGGKADEVVNLIKKAIAVCYPPESVLKEGLILGVDTLAYKFRNSEVCVPEALRVARALNAGLRCLTPYLDQGGQGSAQRSSALWRGMSMISERIWSRYTSPP